MIALDVRKQIEEIEVRASQGLQAFASGEDTDELVTTLIAVVAGIYVSIHDCDANPIEKAKAFAELVAEIVQDRDRNKKMYFAKPVDYNLENLPY